MARRRRQPHTPGRPGGHGDPRHNSRERVQCARRRRRLRYRVHNRPGGVNLKRFSSARVRRLLISKTRRCADTDTSQPTPVRWQKGSVGHCKTMTKSWLGGSCFQQEPARGYKAILGNPAAGTRLRSRQELIQKSRKQTVNRSVSRTEKAQNPASPTARQPGNEIESPAARQQDSQPALQQSSQTAQEPSGKAARQPDSQLASQLYKRSSPLPGSTLVKSPWWIYTRACSAPATPGGHGPTPWQNHRRRAVARGRPRATHMLARQVTVQTISTTRVAATAAAAVTTAATATAGARRCQRTHDTTARYRRPATQCTTTRR